MTLNFLPYLSLLVHPDGLAHKFFKGCNKVVDKEAYSLFIVIPNSPHLPPIPKGQENWPTEGAKFASTYTKKVTFIFFPYLSLLVHPDGLAHKFFKGCNKVVDKEAYSLFSTFFKVFFNIFVTDGHTETCVQKLYIPSTINTWMKMLSSKNTAD